MLIFVYKLTKVQFLNIKLMKDTLCLQKPFCGFLLLTLLVYVLSGVFSSELSAQITHNIRKADLICQDEPMPSVLKKNRKDIRS